MKVSFKNTDFFGVPFPVVLADRYFKVYENEIGLTLDVIRWDPAAGDGVYEVLKGRENAQELRDNPTGIINFDMQGGAFVFKFSPKPGVSSINGKAPVNGEWSVRISDRDVTVLKDGTVVQSLARGQSGDAMIGIQINADGTVESQGGSLPDGLEVERL